MEKPQGLKQYPERDPLQKVIAVDANIRALKGVTDIFILSHKPSPSEQIDAVRKIFLSE